MFLSCSSLTCPRKRFPHVRDSAAKIRALGFRAMDLAAVEGWESVDPSELLRAGRPWIEDFIEATGRLEMHVSSLNCRPSISLNDGSPGCFARYLEEFRVLVDLAAATGCRNITLQSTEGYDRTRCGELMAIERRHLTELAAECNSGEGPLNLSVEAHTGTLLQDPAGAVEYIRDLWPAVGLTYDPSHLVSSGIPLRETEPLLEFTQHVHLRGAAPGSIQSALASGTVEVQWLIRALDERGYGGFVTIEYFSDFDPEFREVLALRRALLELGVRDPEPRRERADNRHGGPRG